VAFVCALLVSAVAAAGTAADSAPPAPATQAAPLANPFGRKYPPRIYDTVRLQGRPPVIDGRLDDEAWTQGEWAGDYTQQTPIEGAKPTAPTELKILYDADAVYMAIRAWDDPARVHRYPGRRDDFQDYAVDVVGICFDSYNDKRTGFEFDLTAGGGKIDLVLGNGENEWDTNWDSVWDGRVAHDDKGWTAEFRVPLNQLRYGPQDEQVWGMHAWRWIARNHEEDQWQLIPRQNTGRMYQLGELHGIHGLHPSRHLELLPHVVGSASAGPSTPGEGADGGGSAGLDAKLGLSTNFALDATFNPDFGQVEADPSVVNLTAYETFYDEKRPFFLEGKKILTFGLEDSDQLFYSRRIGEAPSLALPAGPGETVRMPDATTILSALKLSGKTSGGLSVAALQSLTQKETARVSSPFGTHEAAVEPFGSYTVVRLHKDWDKGNTSLGGMITSTHHSISDPGLVALPSQAFTGGLDFTRYFADRAWFVEASGVLSRVSGDRPAMQALQTNPVHDYQRVGATHLGVDPEATSLAGNGGFVHFGTTGKKRLGLTDRYHWYSPGLDLNEVGYLRQADVRANQAFLGWSEPSPRSIFRSYSVQVSREDFWDYGGLQTMARTGGEATATFRNKMNAQAGLWYNQGVDTGALRGGPALRTHEFYNAQLSAGTDYARRLAVSAKGEHSWAVHGDDSQASKFHATLSLRPSNRLSLAAETQYEKLLDNLQYAATADTGAGPRWVVGRIDQDTWGLTFRANLTLSPDLTLQYYGSPFLSSGRYTRFKRVTDPLAQAYAQRFHEYGPEEIAYAPRANAYSVSEAGGPDYAFPNPDFSFREFRQNFVARWEFKPGSSLYLVWSQGRTGSVPLAPESFGHGWDALWRTPADNVLLVKLSYWFSP
jgi:uncharacterized protein DUF5916/cellulose/xylan binding protein with CBM9 domain